MTNETICKHCGKSEAKHMVALPADTFTKCPVCHYEATDIDDLLKHAQGPCQKGLNELAEEVRSHPRSCNNFEPLI